MSDVEPCDDSAAQIPADRGVRSTNSDKPRRPYALRRPCGSCPFRSDIDFHLHPERAQEIADSLRSDRRFDCHGTLDYSADDEGGPRVTDRTNFCAGALKTVLNGDDLNLNAPMQIAERLGYFSPEKLQQDMPVYGSLDEWVQHMRDLNDSTLGKRSAPPEN